MELKVYINQSAWRNGKAILCRRVASADIFDFHATINVLRVLFGNDCVIEVLCV